MTNDQLAAILAERVMGWTARPDRYIKAGRNWIPRWRFDPLTRLEDAFLLLDAIGGTYTVRCDSRNVFMAFVQFDGRTGEACGELKARTITLAISRALGIEGL